MAGSNLSNPGNTAGLIAALSASSAHTIQAQLAQQLQTANDGMATWAQNFAGHITTAQTALAAFQRSTESTFDGFAEGMTKSSGNLTSYASAVGEAMAKTLKSVLSSISSESVVRALYNSGLGFYYLAIQAYDQAAQAFEAAAIFGSIAGVAASVSGATAGSGSSNSSTSHSTSRPSTTSARGVSSTATPAGSGNLTVMVMGEPQAAAWLTRVINTGVEKYDLRLTASHTKRSAPAGR